MWPPHPNVPSFSLLVLFPSRPFPRVRGLAQVRADVGLVGMRKTAAGLIDCLIAFSFLFPLESETVKGAVVWRDPAEEERRPPTYLSGCCAE